MSADFQTAVRGLHLPTAAGREDELAGLIAARLDALGVQPQDRAQWLRAEQAIWGEVGAPSATFRTLVAAALNTGDDGHDSIILPPDGDAALVVAARRLAVDYFNLHRRLAEEHFLAHDQARQLLSYSGLILRMRLIDQMSASEIARWMAAADSRLPLNWRAIQLILQRAGAKPQITTADVENIFALDTDAEMALFGDQTEAEAIRMIGDVADELGVTHFGAGDIRDLVQGHPPYLHILHFQLTIQARFDHALSYLYEFAPRGVAAGWLRQRYEAARIEVGASPFLNNAKAVDQADANWVASREANQREAKALSSILLGLESLGASAKSELSMILRRFLCRVIRLRQEQGARLRHELPDCTAERVARLLAGVGAGNSETYGILEQRALEALIEAEHPHSKMHGVGDSVFATNTHRKKLGDFEVRRYVPDAPVIDAYEAHGGRLSAHYVDDHLRSYARVLAGRIDDLEAVAKVEDWTLRVIFVSHAADDGLAGPRDVALPGDRTVKVEIMTQTYQEVIDRAGNVVDAWNRHVTARMNSPLVPSRFRERVLALMAPAPVV